MEKNLTFLEDMRKAFDAAKNIPKEELIFTYNGVMYPTALCDIETFKTIETFEAREEDLILVAYPKCGTNWTMLLLNGILDAAYKKEPAKVIPMIEFKAPNKFERLKAEPSPRLLGTHMHYDNIPQPFLDKKVKMLVIFRNPKDTAVSYFHFCNNNPLLPTYNCWDDFFPDFMAGKVVWGSYFDHAIVWNKHLDKDTILLETFENMKEDLEGSVRKICKFFGISITEEQVKQIAEKGTFKLMKENSEKTHGDIGKVVFRKGTNWTLILLNGILDAAYKKEPAKVIPIIEFKESNKLEKLKAEPSPRLLGTHMHYDNIPQSFFDKKVKMLVTFRNPKDTAVSYFHFYNNNPMLPNYNSWDEFFPDFMAGKVIWGSYFDHAVAWNKHLDKDTIFLKTFEDMKEDLEGSVRKICKFFGISITEEQVKKIAEKGTFKSMKENSEKTHGDLGQVIFRKGDVGDWKDYFSEAQSQEVDAKFEECLGGTKLGELLKYNVFCKW